MTKTQLLVLMTPVILFSLTVHEYSHGRMALLLGDDTAQRLGRLSFNPIRHLDITGVLFFYFVGFGWAKPVPVDWRWEYIPWYQQELYDDGWYGFNS